MSLFCRFQLVCTRTRALLRREPKENVGSNPAREVLFLNRHQRTALHIFLLVIASTFLSPFVFGQTQSLVVPKEAVSGFGDSWTYGFAAGRNYAEQIYAASEFAAAVADTIVITEVAFRADESYAHAVDFTWEFVSIGMNVFPGSMEEIVKRKSGVTNVAGGVEQRPFYVTARANVIDAFDIRFPLRVPFAYDRKLGPLVLSFYSISQSGPWVDLDAQGVPTIGGVPARGGFIYSEFSSDPQIRIRPVIAATKFTYVTKWAKITEVVREAGSVRLVATVIGSPLSSVTIEGASDVDGNYTQEPDVQFTARADGKVTAELPVPARNRFYRIALN